MQSLHYTGCGLDNVYLVNGYTEKETPYGHAVAIEDLEGLHRAIGKFLVCNKRHLTGKEIRFLRHQMEMSQRSLGEVVGKSEQQVGNWEKGKSRIPKSDDTLVRTLFLEYIKEKSEIRSLVQKINEIEEQEQRQFCAELDDGWHLKTA